MNETAQKKKQFQREHKKRGKKKDIIDTGNYFKH